MTQFSQIDFLDKLTQYHRLFYGVFELGEPLFSDEVDTAAVAFNNETGKVDFLLNEDFFNSLSENEQLFLVCHEALHVVFSHIERTKKFNLNPELSNIAQDIVINELLVNEFGFIRDELPFTKNACFVDTVFSNTDIKTKKIINNGSFEYYYELLIEKAPKNIKTETIDDHDFVDESGKYSDIPEEVADSLVKAATEIMSNGEVNSLLDSLKEPLSDKVNSAGTNSLGSLYGVTIEKVNTHKRWETIVKNKVASLLKIDSRENETFVRKPRRLTCLQDDLFLPEFIENEVSNNDKFNIAFFLDASGSCISFKNQFFSLANSIPKDKFNINLYSFDTSVYKLDIKNPKVYGGGGTSFAPIERAIQKDVLSEKNFKGKYPDLVFVLTDGYGDRVTPEKPKNWFWLMTEDYTHYVPTNSNYLSLSDFKKGKAKVMVK